jgi:AraC-like DNA-binding protein
VWEEGTRIELVPAEGARVQVRYESFTPASARAVEIDGQQTVVFLLGLARSWFGARAPIAAGFACGPPRHPRSAPPAVACRYGEPAWYVEIPNPEEARLVRPPHPALGSLLARALAEESDRVARPLDLRGRVRDLLRARVASAPTLAAVASMVGMSPRSLQAQLKRAETTFADELAAVRVEGARALLADPDVSVKAVAQAMGFSETAAFTRFFRRQTGSPPSRFARPEEP